MTRYVKAPPRARLYVEDDSFPEEGPMLPNLTVDSSECAETGLLWADGSIIWRAPNPVGFGRDEEWM